MICCIIGIIKNGFWFRFKSKEIFFTRVKQQPFQWRIADFSFMKTFQRARKSTQVVNKNIFSLWSFEFQLRLYFLFEDPYFLLQRSHLNFKKSNALLQHLFKLAFRLKFYIRSTDFITLGSTDYFNILKSAVNKKLPPFPRVTKCINFFDRKSTRLGRPASSTFMIHVFKWIFA